MGWWAWTADKFATAIRTHRVQLSSTLRTERAFVDADVTLAIVTEQQLTSFTLGFQCKCHGGYFTTRVIIAREPWHKYRDITFAGTLSLHVSPSTLAVIRTTLLIVARYQTNDRR